MKNACKVLIICLVSLLFLYACESKDNLTSDKSNEPSKSTTPQASSKIPTKLTADELFGFELLRADWTDEQMIDLGLKKEVNELAGERTYSNGSVMYSYGNIYGNNKTPDLVDVYGVIDVKGPRDIAIGDSFEDVLKKFPQEEDWKTGTNGEFYGEVNKAKVVPTGTVYVSENGKEIMIWPQEQVPCLDIFFKDDKVDHYIIYIQNIFD